MITGYDEAEKLLTKLGADNRTVFSPSGFNGYIFSLLRGTIMTPLEIGMLFHFHTMLTPHPMIDNKLHNQVQQSFLHNGLIKVYGEIVEGIYTTTDRGRAHVEVLCTTPWPVCRWVDRDNNVIQIQRTLVSGYPRKKED